MHQMPQNYFEQLKMSKNFADPTPPPPPPPKPHLGNSMIGRPIHYFQSFFSVSVDMSDNVRINQIFTR